MFNAWINGNRLDAVLSDIPGIRNCLEQAGYRMPRDLGLARTFVSDCTDEAGIDPRFRGSWARCLFNRERHAEPAREQGLPEIPFSILIDGLWRDGKTLRDAAELSCGPLAV